MADQQQINQVEQQNPQQQEDNPVERIRDALDYINREIFERPSIEVIDQVIRRLCRNNEEYRQWRARFQETHEEQWNM